MTDSESDTVLAKAVNNESNVEVFSRTRFRCAKSATAEKMQSKLCL